ncbi:hypothetical protein AEQ67_28445 [Pseudomonas sp. RIT-PI-q]|uniref:hypothetical protein n=1 Tax=Pseudomonas sp. RIT-PI-q TaxID=1690247 RepID=UPI0006CD94E1|nr:hypothetical protein [Pseudomonas sp. RIT-PI-q]KPG91912.1 hypothetical protein AEQ67_28445 [Pseudomonas sp. RIT-PI-q]
MEFSQEAMYSLFQGALRPFLDNEASSIRSNTSERHLCSRLAIQFEKLLPSYNLGAYYADTEYNRKQEGKIKTVVLGDMQVIKVTCDLIVHSRGEQGRDNLIAIEMAKPDKTAEQIHSDRLRLMALTKRSFDDVWSYDGVVPPEHVCGYLLGAFIMVDRTNAVVSVEFFEDGASTVNKRNFAF